MKTEPYACRNKRFNLRKVRLLLKRSTTTTLSSILAFHDVEAASKLYSDMDPRECRVLVRFDVKDGASVLEGKYNNTFFEWLSCPREGTPGSPIERAWSGRDLVQRLFEFAQTGVYRKEEANEKYEKFQQHYSGKHLFDIYVPIIVLSKSRILEEFKVCYAPRERNVLGRPLPPCSGYFYRENFHTNELQILALRSENGEITPTTKIADEEEELLTLLEEGFQQNIYTPRRRIGIRAVKTPHTVEVYDWVEEIRNVPYKSIQSASKKEPF
ncbi:hypothetical protein D6774_03430 [Candidatus Woesearchaeota archaeon]|nr:MAG: hypothetical protein D6774_03430 [Candidatus Woesearchaeota archaeon]